MLLLGCAELDEPGTDAAPEAALSSTSLTLGAATGIWPFRTLDTRTLDARAPFTAAEYRFRGLTADLLGETNCEGTWSSPEISTAEAWVTRRFDAARGARCTVLTLTNYASGDRTVTVAVR